LKLMLEGVKPSACSDSVGLSGGGTSAVGNMPAVPSTRTFSTRAAHRARSVSVNHSSLMNRRSAIGPRLAEQAAGIARRVDLLVIELRPPRADQRPDRVAIGMNWISF
jgi:hypothetical protein